MGARLKQREQQPAGGGKDGFAPACLEKRFFRNVRDTACPDLGGCGPHAARGEAVAKKGFEAASPRPEAKCAGLFCLRPLPGNKNPAVLHRNRRDYPVNLPTRLNHISDNWFQI